MRVMAFICDSLHRVPSHVVTPGARPKRRRYASLTEGLLPLMEVFSADAAGISVLKGGAHGDLGMDRAGGCCRGCASTRGRVRTNPPSPLAAGGPSRT